MASDPRVNLTFSLFKPRYIQTGVDPFDLERMVSRIDRWEDWCGVWSAEAKLHEVNGDEAAQRGRLLSSSEAYLRAAIYYHYAKHYFLVDTSQALDAHKAMLRTYAAAARGIAPPPMRLEIPYDGTHLSVYLRVPATSERPPVVIIVPGLDACKEELHAWSQAFIERGIATVTIDGPGQGETAPMLPITSNWGRVIGSVIDVLETRTDVDGMNVGVVGQSLGALYAPLAAAQEPRIRACIANCGPFDYGAVVAARPKTHLSEMFRVRCHAPSDAAAFDVARKLSLVGLAERIVCPLLVVFGGGDKLIPPSEGERLAREASGPSEFVYFPEGNHVCFNITYKFRPLTADWMAEKLRQSRIVAA